MRSALRSIALLVVACAAHGGSVSLAEEPAGEPADAPLDGRLDRDLAERLLALRPGRGPERVDVWIVLAPQPAADVAHRVRPAYAARIDGLVQPVRERLAEIEPLLPPRSERRTWPVARQAAAEDALLAPAARATRAAVRRETAALLREMRSEILARAWTECTRQQQPIVDHITGLGGSVLARSSLLNALIVRIRIDALAGLLADHDEIARIAEAGSRRLTSDVSVPVVGAATWADAGVDGSSQRIAILDSGIDDDHPAFEDSNGDSRVVAAIVSLATAASESDFDDDDTSTDDLQGHGTHVAAIAASSDATYGGVAPGAPLLDAKCFYRDTSGGGRGVDADIVTAADWALTNGAAVMNLSFGDGGASDATNLLTIFFDAVAEIAGVPVAVASGNSGPGVGSVLIPGDGVNVVAVGAFDDRGTASLSDDRIAGYSGRGPSDDGRRKPELTAPGTSITAASATWEGSGADFVTKSGTSMATPHVTGALALLLDHESSWQPEALRALLLNTVRNASPAPSTPDDVWGAGTLDLGAAYTDRARVLTGATTSTGAAFAFFALDSVAVGDRATLAWQRDAAYAATGRGAGGGSARALVNMDLRLFDEASGAQDVASSSTVDPVEQVKATTARTSAVLKVSRTGSFPSGQTSLDWAVASTAGISRVDPPLPTVALDVAGQVRGGATLSVVATLGNSGELRAHAPTATLVLPTGWAFAPSSVATQTAAALDPGADADVSWSVVAPATDGSAILSVTARSTSYGETFDATADSATVVVDATPPVAAAGADIAVLATSADGAVVELDASASSDDSGRALSFAWDADGDGGFDEATGASPAVPLAIGVHDVAVRVSDHVGNTADDAVRVTVLDNPPVADAGIDTVTDEGATVAFDGASSHDVEGTLDFAWSFGDGGTSDVASPTHVYRNQGTYTASLRVTDSAGQSATASRRVIAVNLPPVVSAGSGRVVGEGQALALVAAASDAGIDDVLDIRWEFGDDASAAGASVSHAYRQDGIYTARVIVSDGDGGTTTADVRVDVRNLAPIPDGGPDLEADEGSVVSFSGTAVDPGVDDAITLSWVFGDGASAEGAQAAHAFVRDGRVTARLVARDDAGAEASDPVTIIVRNVPPSLVLPDVVRAPLGTTLRLTLAPTDPSPSDEAQLGISWSIVDAAGAPIASGGGRDVSFAAAAAVTGALHVAVADDDVQVAFQTVFETVTPTASDVLAPVQALGLSARDESRLMAAIVAVAATPPGSRRGRTRKASRSVRRAARAVDGAAPGGALLRVGLDALAADLARGVVPVGPRPALPDSSDTPRTTRALVAALPTLDLTGRGGRRFARALLALSDAEARERPVLRIERLRAKAARLADGLDDPDAADWFRASLVRD